jgi:RNA polymerase sigma-70 factor (ECF subfamily)
VTAAGTRGEAPTLAQDDQGRLLVTAASGDRPTFISLFSHFAPHIKACLVRSGTRPDVAEGIAQDVMLAVCRNASAYDPASAAAWIFAIARNPRIDLVRHERWPEIGPNDPQLHQAGPGDA